MSLFRIEKRIYRGETTYWPQYKAVAVSFPEYAFKDSFTNMTHRGFPTLEAAKTVIDTYIKEQEKDKFNKTEYITYP